MIPHKHFLTNLIRIRIDRRMTKRETAAQCRINYVEYDRIEQGKCNISVGVLYALSDGLGVNFFEIMGIDMYQIPKFSCYESRFVTEDMEEIRTYGIEVCCQTAMTRSECDTFIFHYSDLTTEKDELESLVDRMNQGQLQLVHVEDVIEDFLAEL
jgi:transcriptional regulator with XRE-family HTH domain